MNNYQHYKINQINHIKKKSCVLYNINVCKMHNKIKEKFFDQSYNNIYYKNSNQNLTGRLNTSLNPKESITNTKTTQYSRPYIKQLSQYCFLTLKNKNNIDNNNLSKLNETNNFENFNTLEKDDKTNIYFNLIKTYYDENGKKLKPKKTEINTMDNDSDYPQITKNKKNKKKNSIDNKAENEIFLNFEKKNKTMNNNCNIIFAEIEYKEKENNDKLYFNRQKIIKNKKSNNITSKKPFNISYGELIYNKKLKNIICSPNISEKSFNKFFQNKSGDYLMNKIQKNSTLKNNVNILNLNSNSLTDIKNISDISFSNDNKNNPNITTYFNKRVINNRKSAIKNSEIKLTRELTSYDNLKKYNINNKKNTHIFQKKKISDSFDDKSIKNNKITRDNQLYINLNSIQTINSEYQNNNTQNFNLNSGENTKHHNITLSWNKITINNDNNNNNINTIISPKRLEKYFNPKKYNKKTLPYKTQYLKTQPESEIIDINNITFKKPFKLVKNIKKGNNSINEIIENNSTNTNTKNEKKIISPYTCHKKYNKKTINYLSQNISQNYEKQKQSSTINNNNTNDKNTINNSNIINSYNIKYIKNQFKQNPFNFSNDKITPNQHISFNNIKQKINENNEKINSISHIKYFINSYNNKTHYKNNQMDKNRKYIIQSRLQKENNFNSININNNRINEINIKKNLIEGFLSPKNGINNINLNITKTEPSIVYNQKKAKKHIINPVTGNKTLNHKITNEKEKKGNKKTYIIKKKIKEGIIKIKK